MVAADKDWNKPCAPLVASTGSGGRCFHPPFIISYFSLPLTYLTLPPTVPLACAVSEHTQTILRRPSRIKKTDESWFILRLTD